MRQKKEGQTLRLKLRDLQMLQALAEAGSMAAAAEQLALSQPAISKAMSEMEYGLGAQLLDRSSRGVVLTESGRVYCSTAGSSWTRFVSEYRNRAPL